MSAKKIAKPKVSKDLQVLLKADNAVLALSADKEGRMRVNARSMADAVVVLPGEVLLIRWENGQVVAVKRKK